MQLGVTGKKEYPQPIRGAQHKSSRQINVKLAQHNTSGFLQGEKKPFWAGISWSTYFYKTSIFCSAT